MSAVMTTKPRHQVLERPCNRGTFGRSPCLERSAAMRFSTRVVVWFMETWRKAAANTAARLPAQVITMP